MLSLGRETRDFFFHFSCSFTAKFIFCVFLRSLFLVLYDKSHYFLRLPKKPPQSNESQLNDGYIRVIFLTEKHLSPRDFVWLNSPTWENFQFCCTHFTIPLVSLGAKLLGQAKDICTTIINNHHHLIIYLTTIHHQIVLTVFT